MNRMEPQNTPITERVYRHIDLTAAQIDRLPLYVRVALASADAAIARAEASGQDRESYADDQDRESYTTVA